MEDLNRKKDFLIQNSEILNKILDYYIQNKTNDQEYDKHDQEYIREIYLVLNHKEDNFDYSAPEVVDYCYNIVYTCYNLKQQNINCGEWKKYVINFIQNI